MTIRVCRWWRFRTEVRVWRFGSADGVAPGCGTTVRVPRMMNLVAFAAGLSALLNQISVPSKMMGWELENYRVAIRQRDARGAECHANVVMRATSRDSIAKRAKIVDEAQQSIGS